MDTQQATQAGLNCTPAKAIRSDGSGGSDTPSSSSQSELSTLKQHPQDDSLLLSPAISYLARKSSKMRGPPALSAKPRKSNSLFGNREDDEDGHSSNSRNTVKSFLTTGKRSDDGDARIEITSTASFMDEDPGDGRQKSSLCETLNTTTTRTTILPGRAGAHDEQAQIRGFDSASSWADATGSFASPARHTVSSPDRFTPQRNLGGLFLSPVPTSRGRSSSEIYDEIVASASPSIGGITLPIHYDMQLQSRPPKREEEEGEVEEEEEEAGESGYRASLLLRSPLHLREPCKSLPYSRYRHVGEVTFVLSNYGEVQNTTREVSDGGHALDWS